ncbi:MAG TPA: transcriptional regulator [Candidatus Saccharibacteria bacterium]|nr:transcriptional regulator [Candidatus Saccharibacteria bacterium]
MIDALFGSKTRIKLLHLFLNNPGKSFYVREITRLIDEQINSVRRELSNMLNVGIIKSDSADNKLYYEVNQRYEHYVPLRAIFADEVVASEPIAQTQPSTLDWQAKLDELGSIKLAALSGVFVQNSGSSVDLLLVGTPAPAKLRAFIKALEKKEGREINYSVMPYDEFYYRLSIRDKFITELIASKHTLLRDEEHVLTRQK